ncbi:phage tail protein [Deinococcus sp. RIT780]|uniref:phage tail protein n=1 Tax=Deinococcus sp. RIT780 TaxID=2870472 RepID=UPI001C89C356|nr:tail fiber protein [Deinococcus sp. RIT780]MBX8465250.1 tail fiber protein [Deinococcus sp. RIT780]
MSDPFVGEVRLFAGNFPPRGWATCDGQLLPISQNTALFSLLGTYYGGDGRSTFALPDLRGRVPIHHGQGPGLSDRSIGETGGSAAVTLLTSEIPGHTHTVRGAPDPAESSVPGGKALSRGVNLTPYAPAPVTPNTTLNPAALTAAGGDLPHNNLPPSLTLTFIIALQGVFPPRQ